jgi:hypothetical protein
MHLRGRARTTVRTEEEKKRKAPAMHGDRPARRRATARGTAARHLACWPSDELMTRPTRARSVLERRTKRGDGGERERKRERKPRRHGRSSSSTIPITFTAAGANYLFGHVHVHSSLSTERRSTSSKVAATTMHSSMLFMEPLLASPRAARRQGIRWRRAPTPCASSPRSLLQTAIFIQFFFPLAAHDDGPMLTGY